MFKQQEEEMFERADKEIVALVWEVYHMLVDRGLELAIGNDFGAKPRLIQKLADLKQAAGLDGYKDHTVLEEVKQYCEAAIDGR